MYSQVARVFSSAASSCCMQVYMRVPASELTPSEEATIWYSSAMSLRLKISMACGPLMSTAKKPVVT